MPLIKPRTRGKQLVKHRTRLDRENNETLYAYAHFLCCRLVRGFALDDDEAFIVLAAWNARCQPPWTDADLRDKVRRARQYGREPIGGLL